MRQHSQCPHCREHFLPHEVRTSIQFTKNIRCQFCGVAVRWSPGKESIVYAKTAVDVPVASLDTLAWDTNYDDITEITDEDLDIPK